jgi:hypothetical protein
MAGGAELGRGERRARRSTKKEMVRYSTGEIGKVRIVKDFLPSPDQLVPVEDNIKVTLSLTRRSLDFFKREARQRSVPFQRIIRTLVDEYADRHKKKGA